MNRNNAPAKDLGIPRQGNMLHKSSRTANKTFRNCNNTRRYANKRIPRDFLANTNVINSNVSNNHEASSPDKSCDTDSNANETAKAQKSNSLSNEKPVALKRTRASVSKPNKDAETPASLKTASRKFTSAPTHAINDNEAKEDKSPMRSSQTHPHKSNYYDKTTPRPAFNHHQNVKNFASDGHDYHYPYYSQLEKRYEKYEPAKSNLPKHIEFAPKVLPESLDFSELSRDNRYVLSDAKKFFLKLSLLLKTCNGVLNNEKWLELSSEFIFYTISRGLVLEPTQKLTENELHVLGKKIVTTAEDPRSRDCYRFDILKNKFSFPSFFAHKQDANYSS